MRFASAIGSFGPQQWAPRWVAWAGGCFIAVIVALAAYDIVGGYRQAAANTARELDTQARVIAEQTARSIQAADVLMRHVVQQFQAGILPALSVADLHAYLKDQAVGLVQIDGLAISHPDGTLRAAAHVAPGQQLNFSLAGYGFFEEARGQRGTHLVVGELIRSPVDGLGIIPVARRLESSTGEFAGAVVARLRSEYFQQFYRDIRVEIGTTVTLLHNNSALLARHPPLNDALGKRLPQFESLVARYKAAGDEPIRTVSSLDGVERFVALQPVAGYPVTVVVARDTAVALAPWRDQMTGTAARTLALSALAVLLIALLMRQIRRLDEARRSREISEERYALAVAGSDDGIWDFDFVNQRVFSSARGRELAGLPPGPEMQPMDEWLAKFPIHPEDAPRRLAAMEAHLSGKAPAYDGEFRVRQLDGSYRWVRIHGLCLRDANGKPYRMAGSVSDIDNTKRAEEALRAGEAQYRVIFNAATDALVMRDADAHVIDVNPAFTAITGYTREDVVNGAPWTFAHRERGQWANETHRRVIDGETIQVEIHSRRKDGTPIELDVRGVPIVHRGLPHTLAIARDITAQKTAERALRASEQRFALAVDGSNHGLWDWDLISDRLFLSARAQEFMGLAPGEPVRSRREWISLSPYHPDDRDAVRAAISAHLRGETSYFTMEYRLRHPSGEWHWYRQRGLARRDDRGRAYRMAGSMEDITAQKHAEAERARLEGQLLQAKKLEALGTLAGGIAHDFNNILAAILGNGEMAQQDAPAGTALRRHVDAAMSAGMRAKSLVERILAFSRAGVGGRAAVHVEAVVAEALDLIAASLPGHVRLERRLLAADARVMGDPTQIHQVVMNLCTNGVQAMKAGGALTVALDVVEKSESMAATSTLSAGRYVRLSVRDTGTGIAANVLERMFDPFFTTKEIGIGTGLGLSLVHGIVTDLGGGIDVESRLGEGTAFTIYLPRSSLAVAAVDVEEAVPNGAGETVLLVDDEEALVLLGEEMIARLGYEPVGFSSSAAALREFRAAPQRFSAVLSDEAMPEMTGSELAAEIRTIRSDIPIVLMSGFVSPALSMRAQEIGIAEIIAKPLVSRDIARSLAGALNKTVSV